MTGWAIPQPLIAHDEFDVDILGRFRDFRSAGYFIVETIEGEPIGRVDYEHLDDRHGSVEVMIYIGESAKQGKGNAADTMRTLARHLFEQRDMHRIELTVLASNIRAIRLYERVGFVREGVIRDNVYFDGRFHDEILMRLTADALKTALEPGAAASP